MAKTDYKGNILGANGLYKAIVPAGSTGQVTPPVLKQSDAPQDGVFTANGTGTPTYTRASRILVTTTGAGSLNVYDAKAVADIATTNLIYARTTPAVGDIYVIDTPCINGLYVVTGAGLQVTVNFS